MTTTTPTPPARRWPWIVAVVVIAALAVTAYLATNTHQVQAPATPSPSPTATATAPSETPAAPLNPVPDAAPTGCLAGPDRDADMVLETINKAPHTSNGAVEFAASITRWLYQRPTPDASQVERVQRDAVASSASDTDIASYYASDPEMVDGLGTSAPFYLSTAPGVYLLESFTTTEATVTIGTGIVQDGALAASSKQSVTITAEWTDNGWRLLDASGNRDVESLFSAGTPFTGGC